MPTPVNSSDVVILDLLNLGDSVEFRVSTGGELQWKLSTGNTWYKITSLEILRGRGITTISVNENNQLLINYSDDTTSSLNLDPIFQEKQISKYTNDASLPSTGASNTIYFIDDTTPHLKYWNGSSFQAATVLKDFHRDYYARFADINQANYTGKFRSICVLKDETYGNNCQLYFSNGTTLIASITFLISQNQ